MRRTWIKSSLERLLEGEIDNKARVYRMIARVYAVDRDYVTSLRFLEQAAEYSTQGKGNSVAADVLWV
jgi:hypothetical protein